MFRGKQALIFLTDVIACMLFGPAIFLLLNGIGVISRYSSESFTIAE